VKYRVLLIHRNTRFDAIETPQAANNEKAERRKRNKKTEPPGRRLGVFLILFLKGAAIRRRCCAKAL